MFLSWKIIAKKKRKKEKESLLGAAWSTELPKIIAKKLHRKKDLARCYMIYWATKIYRIQKLAKDECSYQSRKANLGHVYHSTNQILE